MQEVKKKRLKQIEDEEKIIDYRQSCNNLIGARVIVDHLGLDCSAKTAHKKLKQHGLVHKARTKTQA